MASVVASVYRAYEDASPGVLQPGACASSLPPVRMTPLLAHKVFMHQNLEMLSHLESNVVGLRMDGDPSLLSYPVDEACPRGKAHRRPVDKGTDRRSEQSHLERARARPWVLLGDVTIDIHGTWEPDIDKCTCYLSVNSRGDMPNYYRPMRRPSDLLTTVQQIEVEQGGRFTEVTIDRDVNAVVTSPSLLGKLEAHFTTPLHGLVTKLRTSTPGAHNKSGMSERSGGRTVHEHVTAACEDAGVNAKKVWSYGVRYYEAVENATPRRDLSWQTRHERAYGRRPVVSHFHRFGAPCLLIKVKDERGPAAAWMSRVHRGVWLGPAQGQKPGAYYVLDLETGAVVTERDVYVDDAFRFVCKQPAGKGWKWHLDQFDSALLDGCVSRADERRAVVDADMDEYFRSPSLARRALPAITVTSVGGVAHSDSGAPPATTITSVGGQAGGVDVGSLPDSRSARTSHVPVFFIQDNPKKAGSESHRLYDVYKAATTPAQFFSIHPAPGRAAADWRYDAAAGFVRSVPTGMPAPQAAVAMFNSTPVGAALSDVDMVSVYSSLFGDESFQPSARFVSTDQPLQYDSVSDRDLARRLGFPAYAARVGPQFQPDSAGDVPPYPGAPTRGDTFPNVVPLSTEQLVSYVDFDNMPDDYRALGEVVGDGPNRTAYIQELSYLGRQGTLGMVRLPPGWKPLKSRMLPKHKPPEPPLHPHGRSKYRFLPLGHAGAVHEGEHYRSSELPAPVASDTTQRFVDIVAVERGSHFEVEDISGAFITGGLSKYKIYLVRAPPGMRLPDGYVFLVLGNCYGLPEAPQIFYLKNSRFMTKRGFVPSKADPCLFVRGSWVGVLSLVSTHVDDGKYVFDSKPELSQLKRELALEFPLGIRDYGDIGGGVVCLGIKYTRQEGGLLLSIREPVVEWCDSVGLSGARKTPASPLPKHPEPKDGTPGARPLQPEEQAVYNRIVGILIYIAKLHFEVAQAAAWLGSARARATKHHLDLAKRAMLFCLGVSSRGLLLRRSRRRLGPSEVLLFWSDTDWATCPHTRRSMTSVVAFFYGMLLMLTSNKQKGVALSSTQAETIGMSEAAKKIVPARRLAKSVRLHLPPTVLHCDNSAAKAISECQIKLTSLMRHIAVRHLYVRELVYKGVVVLKWVPSAENIADLGTKALDEKTFDMLVRMILEFGG